MEFRMKKMTSLIALAAAALIAASPSFSSAAYPEKPITLMTAFNAGGGSDVSHRVIEKHAKKYFAQPFVVAYKPGAGGEIAWTWLTTANPNGYTICGVDLPHIVLQPMLRPAGQPGYKTEELNPLCGLVYDANVIMVREDSPFKTLKDLFDYAKAHPGEVTAATVGKLTGDHIFLMMIEDLTGIKFSQVPYPGGGKASPALLSGEVQCYFGSVSNFMRMEKVRGLAVSTAERYEICPDVPTFKELGYDHVSAKVRGLATPPKFNKEAQKYLEEKFAIMCADPEYQKDVRAQGLKPMYLSAQEFAKVIQEEKKNSEAILRKVGALK